MQKKPDIRKKYEFEQKDPKYRLISDKGIYVRLLRDCWPDYSVDNIFLIASPKSVSQLGDSMHNVTNEREVLTGNSHVLTGNSYLVWGEDCSSYLFHSRYIPAGIYRYLRS